MSQTSRVFRDAIKNDKYIPFKKDGKTSSQQGIEYVVALLAREIEKYHFLRECLGPEVALVPIPRSAPLSNKDALWPTRRICEALVAAGLGYEVAPLLIRRTAVQKASTAEVGKRPTPVNHYESTIIDNEVPTLVERNFTLVDDFVTRGSSFVGMFTRLSEAFPNRKISCFALLRTVSDGDIVALKDPVQGRISYYPSGKLYCGWSANAQQNLF